MTTKELIDAMAAKCLWRSPEGKTPERTLYSAIIREIAKKGKAAPFKKAAMVISRCGGRVERSHCVVAGGSQTVVRWPHAAAT
jgi:hypothetical protein